MVSYVMKESFSRKIKKSLFFVTTTITFLFTSNNLLANKNEIPICHLRPDVFDLDLNSYEEFIIEKCFKTFAIHISKGEYLTKEEFLNEIKNDKAFERFIYLYVLIKEYWHAQEGTIVDIDYTMEFEDSLFKNYLIWGAQAGNYYAGLIASIERQTSSVDQEILNSISDNKYYIYETFSMGKDTYIENAQAFFNKYSIEDFDHNNWKVGYLISRSELELELQNKKDPEKWVRMIENIDEDLPDNFYSQSIDLYTESSRVSLYINKKKHHFI